MAPVDASTEARQRRERLNGLLVNTFDAILRIEEQSLNNRLTKGCTIAEIHTIAAVGLHSKDPMSLIASRLGVTLATLTAAIGRLEKRGLVVRERDQEDHRRVLVSLTKEGRKICRAHDLFHRQMVEGALAELTEEEEVVFERAAAKVRDFFESRVE